MNWFDKNILRKKEPVFDADMDELDRKVRQAQARRGRPAKSSPPVNIPVDTSQPISDEDMKFTAEIEVYERGVQDWAYKVIVRTDRAGGRIEYSLDKYRNGEYYWTQESAQKAAEAKAVHLAKALRVQLAPKREKYTKEV